MNKKIDINKIMQMIASNPAGGAGLGAMAGAVNTGGLSRGHTMNKFNDIGNTPFAQLNYSEEQMLNPQPSPQQRYDELQYLGSHGKLDTEEIDEFIMLRNLLNPNLTQERPVTMPIDIDGGSAGSKELSIEDLNKIFERANFMNRR